MGREIRMVPPNWDHPHMEEYPDRLQPMYDRNYADAKREWIEGLAQWEAGTYPNQSNYTSCEWWDYVGPPPDAEYYRPWTDDEATWFQLYETVSEGTPVSPPFPTKEGLADYLAENGDEWDQERCHDPHSCRTFGLTPGKPGWGKERAEKFVFGDGWAPSLVVIGNRVMTGTEAVTQMTDEQRE